MTGVGSTVSGVSGKVGGAVSSVGPVSGVGGVISSAGGTVSGLASGIGSTVSGVTGGNGGSRRHREHGRRGDGRSDQWRQQHRGDRDRRAEQQFRAGLAAADGAADPPPLPKLTGLLP